MRNRIFLPRLSFCEHFIRQLALYVMLFCMKLCQRNNIRNSPLCVFFFSVNVYKTRLLHKEHCGFISCCNMKGLIYYYKKLCLFAEEIFFVSENLYGKSVCGIGSYKYLMYIFAYTKQ